MKRIITSNYVVVLQDGKLLKDRDGYIHEINDNQVVSTVSSLDEASKEVTKFISKHQLGGSTFTGGDVYQNGKKVAHVSYNGRIWDLNDNPIRNN